MAEKRMPACCDKRRKELEEDLNTVNVLLREDRIDEIVDVLMESAAKGAAHKIRDCENIMTAGTVWKSTFPNRIKLMLDLAREGFSIREMLHAWKATSGTTLTLRVTIGEDGITNTQEARSYLKTEMQEWLRKHARPSYTTAS